VEWALVWVGLFLPLTGMIIFTAELLWTWHSVVEFTRAGAEYAATHCFQSGGSNVISYMQSNVPVSTERDQFRDGTVEIQVLYYQKNADSGALEEFQCDGQDCSRECVPQFAQVKIAGYQFRPFMSFLGLPPVNLPDFQSIVPIESAGCNADSDSCTP
jgi:hypothetical protein